MTPRINDSTNPVPAEIVNQDTNPVAAKIVNDSTKPVPVQDVMKGVAVPIHASVGAVFTGDEGEATVYSVPAGKQLVIEHVSAYLNTLEGEKDHALLSFPGSPSGGACHLVLTYQHTWGVMDYYVASQPFRAHVNGIGNITYRVLRGVSTMEPNSPSSAVTITGYLVDQPLP